MKWINKGQVSELVEHVKAMIGKKEEGRRKKEEGPSASTDIPGQIQKLAELKQQGILTEDEFQAKRRELLSKM